MVWGGKEDRSNLPERPVGCCAENGPVPIDFGLPVANPNVAPPGEWFGKHEDVRYARAFVLVINTPGMILGRRDRTLDFFHQLHRLLVHAQHGNIRVVRPGIDVQHIFHLSRKFCICFGGNHPVLGRAFGTHSVFFSVRRTVW